MKKYFILHYLTIALLLPCIVSCNQHSSLQHDNATKLKEYALELTSGEDSHQPTQNHNDVSPLSAFRFGVEENVAAPNIKKLLLDKIEEFKFMSQRDIIDKSSAVQEYDFHEYYEIAFKGASINEISEFYFPNFTIDGYTLYRSVIDEWSFMYYFAPSEMLKEGNYTFEFDTGIMIAIHRSHWIDTENPLAAEIQKLENREATYILKDNMLHEIGSNSISGIIGYTRFVINVPDACSNYDALAALGRKVVESCELVSVN